MLLTELSELLENLFSKLLSQSITQEEYRQKMQEALNEYDAKIRQLREVILPVDSSHKEEPTVASVEQDNSLDEGSQISSKEENGDAKRVPLKLKIKPVIIT